MTPDRQTTRQAQVFAAIRSITEGPARWYG